MCHRSVFQILNFGVNASCDRKCDLDDAVCPSFDLMLSLREYVRLFRLRSTGKCSFWHLDSSIIDPEITLLYCVPRIDTSEDILGSISRVYQIAERVVFGALVGGYRSSFVFSKQLGALSEATIFGIAAIWNSGLWSADYKCSVLRPHIVPMPSSEQRSIPNPESLHQQSP